MDSSKQIKTNLNEIIQELPWYEGELRNVQTQVQTDKAERSRKIVESRKGLIKDQTILKFRKGACSNCGAITHSVKECVERPRKVGAKWSGKDFRPDEYYVEVPLDYEGKRDRWNGYNPSSQKKYVDEWEAIEKGKVDAKVEAGIVVEKRDADRDDSVSSISEDEKLTTDFEKRRSNKLGNYARYLYNADPSEAYYKGKINSIDYEPIAEGENELFKEQPYLKDEGDLKELLDLEKFVEEANEKNPTQIVSY